MMDSTTSEGWTRKTNFKEDEHGIQATIRIEVACSYASCFMTHRIHKYSKWFLGIKNQVADAFSRDMDRTDKELTHFFLPTFPHRCQILSKLFPCRTKLYLG
jgi:hypothetical protein